MPQGKSHRHGPLLGEIFFHLNARMPSRRDIEADGLLIVNHHTVGAYVEPTLFRISGNRQMPGADVASAVADVVARRREAQNVDILLFPDILHERSFFNLSRRNRLHVFDLLAHGGNQIHGRHVRRHTAGKRDPLDRIELSSHDPQSLGKALDGIEKYAGSDLRLLAGHLDNRADLKIPIRAFHGFEFAQLVDLLHPLPQILVSHHASYRYNV